MDDRDAPAVSRRSAEPAAVALLKVKFRQHRDVVSTSFGETFEFSKILLRFLFLPDFSKNQDFAEDITGRC